MSREPFRDIAIKIAENTDYITMSVNSDRARSHGWWRNLVEHGAWGGPGTTRVGPPDPEALPGIAALFGTSKEQVAKMVAADWYDVDCDAQPSPRTTRLAPMLERLSDYDAELVRKLVRRLSKSQDAGDRV